jgi:hypothetical protein
LLGKYGFLTETFIIDPEISAYIEVKKEIKGPHQVSLSNLQNGVEWSCDHLPQHFASIPAALQSRIEYMLGAARARQNWGGDEVVEI